MATTSTKLPVKKIKYFEALDVRVPGAGPETPEEVPEEPETEPLLGTDIEIY